MRRFFDNSLAVLNPVDIVETFTGRNKRELGLPERAIIVFHTGDLRRLIHRTGAEIVDQWSGFRSIYRVPQSNVVITRSHFGGPYIAAIVEELSSFGVQEFILFGYCGAISDTLQLGDLLMANGALREDGVSYHYLDDPAEIIYSDWAGTWLLPARERGLHEGLIWSCDAIYRETASKIERYREQGMLAVEMEVASLYAVCTFKGLKGIAFLVVSDVFSGGTWKGGFHTGALKKGVRELSDFIVEKAITYP
ncbi:MAG: Uridine phosphorylase [Syntrophorhabdus sp. PtaU1.Bin058]|nr:MAG: Uridine phosphorylase [Syntrophorhabdus sp. PtaU1.Bin058]